MSPVALLITCHCYDEAVKHQWDADVASMQRRVPEAQNTDVLLCVTSTFHME